MASKLIEYNENGVTLEGYCATPDNTSERRPAVIIVHDWSGKNEFACQKADQLAELGYIGFALDMYGKGQLGQTNEEKTALMSPLMADRSKIAKRMSAAVDAVKTLDQVDVTRIAVMGFCFGGLCALDLARTGVDIAGAVSIHGLLNAPDKSTGDIKAKILVLHGYADPMVAPDQVAAFADEMNHKHANWEIDMYGHTLHAFTNPQANDHDFGTVYDAQADSRSWARMQGFFREVFGE